MKQKNALRRRLTRAGVAGMAGFLALAMQDHPVAAQKPDGCNGTLKQPSPRVNPASNERFPPDLEVSTPCRVPGGQYHYGRVNIINGGALTFDNADTDFWANDIIIENEGSLVAGSDETPIGTAPDGQKHPVLTFHIYGKDPYANEGADDTLDPAVPIAACVTPASKDQSAPGAVGPCGIPAAVWNDNSKTKLPMPGKFLNGKTYEDYFYQYTPLHHDRPGEYFGNKTFAVGYGGTLVLKGWKGASALDPVSGTNPSGDPFPNAVKSEESWTRLAASVGPAGESIKLARAMTSWAAGDEVVVTTTDYLATHSEHLVIDAMDKDGAKITKYHRYECADRSDYKTPMNIGEVGRGDQDGCPGLRWGHNGERFELAKRLEPAGGRLHIDPDLVKSGAETRAAVALLSRSIRIVSAGDADAAPFPPPDRMVPGTEHGYMYGAHLPVRQGVKQVQIDGVEFYQMGQGGRLGHYPVHFHMARQLPVDSYVRDSAVNDSMTRWYVIHDTLGLQLARNVGYKSIGHGYYLEDGTETDNKLLSNIGVFARASVFGKENPRSIPGLLSSNATAEFPYGSDYVNPSVFWITNGYNEFVGNHAAGAGTCGACYWFVPTAVSRMSSDMGAPEEKWSGYSAEQFFNDPLYPGAGSTPLKNFYKNSCSSTQLSFMATSGYAACQGVATAEAAGGRDAPAGQMAAIPNPRAPPKKPFGSNDYYPNADGIRAATECTRKPTQEVNAALPPDASENFDCTNNYPSNQVLKCSAARKDVDEGTTKLSSNCQVVALDHYTSSFNYAETNFAAIWLRQFWFLINDSFMSDIQGPGSAMISGGDWTHASAPVGYWALTENSVFAGSAQAPTATYPYAANPFAAPAGPFNGVSKLTCDGGGDHTGYCLSKDNQLVLMYSNFAIGQRFINIYDGPVFEAGNAFLDIRATPCAPPRAPESCVYGKTLGLRQFNSDPATAYLPDAAIGWKQPNGFYYPPAFHSDNLFFDNVDIRHYVIEPAFVEHSGQYKVDLTDCLKTFVGCQNGSFAGYTDIDRQTVLNDDDGTLTGLASKRPSYERKSGSTEPPTWGETLSVNLDSFFASPVRTPECRSNVGISPLKTCPADYKDAPPPTADTSPYDHLTTVVVPQCIIADGAPTACGANAPPPPTPGKPVPPDAPVGGRGGSWSPECGSDYCYGVPLYRQNLTGADPKTAGGPTGEWAEWERKGCSGQGEVRSPDCRWPSVRMSGGGAGYRASLTANNTTYYIDTALTKQQQWEKFSDNPNEVKDINKSVNLFLKDETYHLFPLFAKKSTRVTYQMWIGKLSGDQLAAGCKDLSCIVSAELFPIETKISSPKALSPDEQQALWAPLGQERRPGQWSRAYDEATGILTVTMDMSALPGDDVVSKTIDPTKGFLRCQPTNFCSVQGDKCGCSLDGADGMFSFSKDFKSKCDAICAKWPMADMDCPFAGCFGLKINLGHDFVADGKNHRPKPEAYKDGDLLAIGFQNTALEPDNSVPPETGPIGKFDPTAQKPRSCYYKKVPGSGDCLAGQ